MILRVYSDSFSSLLQEKKSNNKFEGCIISFKILDIIKSQKSNQKHIETVRSLLLDGDEDKRSEITIELAHRRMVQFNDLIEENMFSDDSAGVRAASFWALAIMSDKSKTDDLLEALTQEDNPDARMSEIDSFMIFADRHNISAKSINLAPIQMNIKESEIPLIHKKPEPQKPKIEIPSYTVETISEVKVERIEEIRAEEVQKVETVDKVEGSVTLELDTQIHHARTKVKQILLEITPNVPISLRRIAEVTNVTEKSLETYLTDLTKVNPQAGSYFPLEQVFIKKVETVSQVLDPRPSIAKTCMSCGAIAKRFPCEICSEGTQCTTCKLNIGQGEDSLHCPYCKQPSHSKHLLEWLKIKGECPNCREKLNPDEL
ncbi:MAG: hypothetical protein HeimC2_11780 [Candidatus Heimdallarchaeota archaeon LC_2]|nr:MAG: hypothetical protein HeimC2_11780 [Candidatus Heimdallarchaeota archaeon LC_2]